MTDSLTQGEIDALIRGTQSSAMVAPEPVPYNFLQPPRISKEHRGVLMAIHERFAAGLQSFLSARLRTPVELTAVSAEQATFAEAVQALGTPCAAYVFRLTESPPAHGYLDLGAELAYYLVDRLFGGTGDTVGTGRALTALERTVIGGLVERALELYGGAWQDHVVLASTMEGFESNPDALNITTREDNCLVTHLEVRSGAARGFFTLCFPLTVIEEFLSSSFRGRRVSGGPGQDGGARAAVESALQHAGLVLTARFPRLWLSTRKLMDLKPGQMLETGHPVEEPIEVHVNGDLRYRATVGQTRRRLGLRITELVTTPAASRPAPKPGQIP
jgi:flagellar motor switch protein FliM